MKNIFFLIFALSPFLGQAAGVQTKAPAPSAASKAPPKAGDSKAAENPKAAAEKEAKKSPQKFPKYHPLSPENPYRTSAFGDDLCPHVWKISTG
jgi:hypothetical protein